jgi:hypothetical protein
VHLSRDHSTTQNQQLAPVPLTVLGKYIPSRYRMLLHRKRGDPFKHGTDFNCDDATMAYEAAANRQVQLQIPTL